MAHPGTWRRAGSCLAPFTALQQRPHRHVFAGSAGGGAVGTMIAVRRWFASFGAASGMVPVGRSIMSADNPYNSPKNPTLQAATSPAPLLWSVAAVFGSAFLGGLIGLGIGAALGAFVPGYYRSVFFNGTDPSFDPVAVGIGQGLTQGVVFGGIIGLVLVGMFYWYRSRSARRNAD